MSCEPWPSALTLDPQLGELELVWDQRRAVLSGAELRAACRCSGCEAARRRGAALDAADGVRLAAINLIGSSGVQCVFSDGHERGIYPWPYLYSLAFERSVQ